MKLQTVPAPRGLIWVRQGFRAFFKHPLAFAALFAASMFTVFVLALLPFVGSLLVLGMLPLVSLAFMVATRVVAEGGTPSAGAFIEPLRAQRPRVRALLWLALSYAAATFAIVWLSDLADGGAFEALLDASTTAQTSPDTMAARLAAPGLLFGLLLRFGLAGLLAVPFWHAPALVFWDGQGAAQALFSSTLACWRNRAAFMLYSLAWFGLILAFGIVASLVFSLIGTPQMFAVAAVPMSLLFTTVFYASLYFTFADCFVAAESDPAPVPGAA